MNPFIKNLIFAVFCKGLYAVPTAPTEHHIARKDRIGGAYGMDFSLSSFESLAQSQSALKVVQKAAVTKVLKDNSPTSSIQSSFQFNFNCEGTSEQMCDFAKASFVSAGNRISQILLINNPVVVDAKFHSFCQAKGGGSCKKENNTLGRASAAAYFSASDVNVQSTSSKPAQIYYYPQPLVKQLRTSESLNYAPVDIYAEFNSDFNFYFKASGQPIKQNQTDFEFVVAHELTHGLGFDSAWVQYSSFYTAFSPPPDLLAPLPFAEGDTYASSTVSSISPLNIFDSLLQLPNSTASTSSSIATSFGTAFANFKVAGLSLADFIGDLSTDPSLNSAAKSAMQAARTGLQLKSPVSSSPLLVLNTPSNFAQGTSIVHVTANSDTTADFLMIPAVSPLVGKTLDGIMASVNSSLIYGPGISAALAGMGWPTKDDPTVKNLKIVRISSAATSPRAMTASMLFSALFAFITIII